MLFLLFLLLFLFLLLRPRLPRLVRDFFAVLLPLLPEPEPEPEPEPCPCLLCPGDAAPPWDISTMAELGGA